MSFGHNAKCLLFVSALLLLKTGRVFALPSYLSNECSRTLTVGEVIMGVSVASVSQAPANQQHQFELMKDGNVVPCGGSFEQGDSLILKADQALVSLIAANGWSETAGPNYIIEATNNAILESGTAARGCSNSRIVNPAGDISMVALDSGALTIRMLSAHQYGQVYAADECTYTVTGTKQVVTHTGFLATSATDLAAPWDQTVGSLLPAGGTSYTILEEPSEGTFSVKYSFDAAGNDLARAFLETARTSSGADTKDIQVTVTGFAGAGNTVEVVSIDRCQSGTCAGYRASGPGPASDAVCVTDGVCIASSVVDDAAGTITTTITSDNTAWFAIGFSTPGGGMTGGGAGADIIACSGEGLRRFWVTDRRNPEEFATTVMQQDAADAATPQNLCLFEDGKGRMTFTRTLAAGSSAEREIVPGAPQAIIWARGPAETELTSRHATRGEVSLDLTDVSGGVSEVKMTGQWTLWLHLLLMAPAWGVLLPLGAAIANRTKAVEGAPPGAWFKLHKALQRAGWMLQLCGFVLAYAHCDKYSAHWQHPHTYIGLAVVVVGGLQPLNAILRPHPPPGGWPAGKKPVGRLLFEVWHKGFGWAAVLLGMVNVVLGALLARELDFTTVTWAVPLAIGCTGITAFVLFMLLALVAPNNAMNKALTGAKPKGKDAQPA